MPTRDDLEKFIPGRWVNLVTGEEEVAEIRRDPRRENWSVFVDAVSRNMNLFGDAALPEETVREILSGVTKSTDPPSKSGSHEKLTKEEALNSLEKLGKEINIVAERLKHQHLINQPEDEKDKKELLVLFRKARKLFRALGII